MTLEPMRVKSTKEEVTIRREHLVDYLNTQLDERVMPTSRTIIDFMKGNYPDYNIDKLMLDKRVLKQADNFISELSITSYSYFIKEIWDKITIVEREAFKDFDNNSGFVRINAKKIILDAQKLRSDIMATNINISVEKLAKMLRNLQEENKKLKEERVLKSTKD